MKDATQKGFDLQEFIQTLNTLDPQNIGSWPVAVKVFIYIGVFVLVLMMGYMLDLSKIRDSLSAGKQQQVTLLGEFETKTFKAQNLEEYKRQLKDMEDSFGALLRQLPQETEVPGLLEDITHTGIGSGIDFDSIQLAPEAKAEFYAALPINILAHGDYHAFGAFVSGIAALPRIVTLHDFRVEPLTKGVADGTSPVLKLTIQAKTYRYAEGDEGAATDDKKAAKGKKGADDKKAKGGAK